MSRKSLSPKPSSPAKRVTDSIELTDCRGALGVKIIGGRSSIGLDFGIFVRSVLEGGIAARDGRLSMGDQLLEVNGRGLVGVSNDEAIRMLKESAQSGSVHLIVARDEAARMDYRRLSASITTNGRPPALTPPRSTFTLPNPSSSFSSQDDSFDNSRVSRHSYKTQSGDIYATPIPKHQRPSRSATLGASPSYVPTTLAVTTTNTNGSTSVAPHIVSPTITSTPQPTYLPSAGSNFRSYMPSPPDSHGYATVGMATVKRLPSDDPGTGYATVGSVFHQQGTQQSSEPGYATVGDPVGELLRIGRMAEGKMSESPSPSPELSGAREDEDEERGEGEVQYLTLKRVSGLGISVIGGRDKPERPRVYIEKIVEGSAVHQNGRLKVGDQLISVDGETMIGISQQQAQAIITKVRLRKTVKDVRISFIKGMGSSFSQQDSQAGSQSSLISSGTNPQYDSQNSLTSPSDTPIIGPPRHHSNRYSRHARERTPPRKQPVTPKSKLGTLSRDSGVFENPNPARSATLSGPSAGSRGVSPSLSSVDGSPGSAHVRLSIDPECKLKVEKLEVALRYLGFEPTGAQQQDLRSKLNIDSNGEVIYSEFVSAAKELFAFSLDERDVNTSALFYATKVNASSLPLLPKDRKMEEESDLILRKRFVEQASLERQRLAAEAFQMEEEEEERSVRRETQRGEGKAGRSRRGDTDTDRILERLRKERDEAQREVQKLKVKYEEKCRECEMVEQDKRRLRKDSDRKLDEIRAVKNRLHVSEEAHKQARSKEKDRVDALKSMQTELGTLRTEAGVTEMQKKCAVIQCQLKKVESSKKAYEVSTEKLLKFAETAYEVLTKGDAQSGKSFIVRETRGDGESTRRPAVSSGSPRPPTFLSRHSQRVTLTLAQEAKDVVSSVKSLIGDEPLPYGWEEAYTPDGLKYFVNHVTQVTTWIHPTTNVNYAEDVKESVA